LTKGVVLNALWNNLKRDALGNHDPVKPHVIYNTNLYRYLPIGIAFLSELELDYHRMDCLTVALCPFFITLSLSV
jgi:hypothetical protein